MRVVLLVMIISSTCASAKQDEKQKNARPSKDETLKNELETAALESLAPHVNTAVEIAKKLKEVAYSTTSSSNVIGPRERGIGFKSLNIASVMEEGIYFTIDPVIDDYQSFLDRLPVESSLKASGLRFMKSLLSTRMKIQKETMITYQTVSGGKIQMHFFSFFMNADKEYEVRSASLSGEFQTMPDWYINTIHTSKKNFWGSSESSRQEIVYVETGLTRGHIQDLMMVVLPDAFDAKQVFVDAIGESKNQFIPRG